MLEMPVETTWQIDGFYGMPWRWIDLSCSDAAEKERGGALKAVWKDFFLITSSVVTKIIV